MTPSREPAVPGLSQPEASDRSRETCTAGATSISGTTPTSLPCALRARRPRARHGTSLRPGASQAIESCKQQSSSAAAGGFHCRYRTRAVRRRSGDGCPSECEAGPAARQARPGVARSAAGSSPTRQGQAELRAPRTLALMRRRIRVVRAGRGRMRSRGGRGPPDQRGENDVGVSDEGRRQRNPQASPSVKTCAWSCAPTCSDTRRTPRAGLRATRACTAVRRCFGLVRCA